MVDPLVNSLYTLGAIFKGVDNKPVQPEKPSEGSKPTSRLSGSPPATDALGRSPATGEARYYGFAMRIVGDFGATIAIPAVLGAFAGIWLDKRLETAPWLLIVTLGLSFVLTAYMIQKKAKAYGKQFEDLNKKV